MYPNYIELSHKLKKQFYRVQYCNSSKQFHPLPLKSGTQGLLVPPLLDHYYWSNTNMRTVIVYLNPCKLHRN